MKTILITGCSSGFGLETARYFLERDWKVIATMRTPREDVLPRSDRLRVIALDVTDPESIRRGVEAAGLIDVLVNNAGIGWLNALEGTPMDTAREVFETTTIGTLLSVYRASKAAVNAFTESLAVELEPFGIRVRVVLPGRAPETRFGDNARTRMKDGFPEAYASLAQSIMARWQTATAVTHSRDVAEAVWRAVDDPSCPLRLPAGADAVEWASEPARG